MLPEGEPPPGDVGRIEASAGRAATAWQQPGAPLQGNPQPCEARSTASGRAASGSFGKARLSWLGVDCQARRRRQARGRAVAGHQAAERYKVQLPGEMTCRHRVQASQRPLPGESQPCEMKHFHRAKSSRLVPLAAEQLAQMKGPCFDRDPRVMFFEVLSPPKGPFLVRFSGK